MQIARIAALGVAIALAGAAVWSFTRPKPPAGGADGPRTGTAASFDPEPGRHANPDPAVAQAPDRPAAGAAGGATIPVALADLGAPPAPSDAIDLTIPWKRGTHNRWRYEIEDFRLAADRATGNREPAWYVWRALLETIDGDGHGAARLRLTIESVRIRGFNQLGVPYDFRSEVTDDPLLEDPSMSVGLRPLLATLGRPVEFRLDASGNVIDVDGVDDLRDRFLAEYQRLTKDTDTPAAPTRDSVAEQWSEYLFPRLAGSAVAASKPREWSASETWAAPWRIQWRGDVRPVGTTPDGVVAEVRATPEAVMSGASAPWGASIEKVRAIPREHGYRAQYRVSRTDPGVAEASIHVRYEVWTAFKAGGGGPGSQGPAPQFVEIDRRVRVTRTPADP